MICAYLWWSLSVPARIAGFVWLATGIAYGAWKTQGFKKRIEFKEAADSREFLASPMRSSSWKPKRR